VKIKKLSVFLLLAIAGSGWYFSQPPAARPAIPVAGPGPRPGPPVGADTVAAAFDSRESGQWLDVEGVVSRTLEDDRNGSPHQRFIIETNSGKTLLIAHNISLAPRLDGLRAGERVRLRGEYVWNDRGGLLHWTHHDPQGRRSGFIEWNGRRYE
jgi:hypothetical protein